LVLARLQEAWRDRPVLPAGSAPRRVVIGFRIARDGTVSDARILVPSGYTPLDLSALRAAQSIGRLPRLPRSYPHERLGARFVFELVPPR
ncbi:MAG: TonB family protein, partial [Acidobacteria bacterium]